MGKDIVDAFPLAQDTLAEVDEALKQHLTRLIFEGPQEELTSTDNAQPALMAVSMAIYRVLAQGMSGLQAKVHCVAGHSLGEYSALTAAGMFTVTEAARLLRIRGAAMNAATPPGTAGMAALLGGDGEASEQLAYAAAQGQVCVVANDNAPEQQVISGHIEAIERALSLAPERGFKRALLLPVSSAFHSPLMASAQPRMADAFLDIPGQKPRWTLISNVTAAPVQDPEQIRALLVDQIVERVRWCESIRAMKAAGVSLCVEIGAGKVLSGLVKRIEPDIETVALNTPHDLDAFIKRF
jgi:[acyl-carrier-protein] S-malonyltransferase